MAAVIQMGYIGIGASDLATWEDFATNILGLTVSQRGDDGSLFLRMDELRYRLIVERDPRDDLSFIGWQVESMAALQELTRQLEAHGTVVRQATPEEIRARQVVGMVKFKDPNGIDSELFFGPLVEKHRPFLSPRGVTFKTGSMGVGHITMRVDNFDESLRFYRDALGMNVTDWVFRDDPTATVMMVFLHCNPRHHTMAFSEGKSDKRIHHFMLECNSIDDVGAAYDLCQGMDMPFDMTLGRNANDHMLSFYVLSPSGFDVEFGWGGRSVGGTPESPWLEQAYKSGTLWGHRNVKPATNSGPYIAPSARAIRGAREEKV